MLCVPQPLRAADPAHQRRPTMPTTARDGRSSERHYRWSARCDGQGRLPFAPKTGERPKWAAETCHEIKLLLAASWGGVAGFEPSASSSRTGGAAEHLS